MKSSAPARARPRTRLIEQSVRTPVPRLRWWLVTLALAVIVTYANSLNGPFFLDDVVTVVDNTSVHDLLHLRDVFVASDETPLTGRPLVALTFVANYVSGGTDVRWYHLWNIAMHLLVATALFGVVRRLLGLPRLKGRWISAAVPTAFCVALLWAVHPLNTEAVNYLTQRTEVMMGFFYLATLYASLRAVEEKGKRWTTVAVVCCAAGMACKESMVTAPLAVLLVDRLFVFESMRKAAQARWRLYVGLAATWAFLAVLHAPSPNIRSAGFSTNISVWTYLLNQAVMIVRYLRLAVWPTSLVVNYGWPLPLHLRDVWLYGVVVVALLIATTVALWKRPAFGFMGAWFFLTLAPTSSILPIATEVGAERRMYLPLMAIVTLAVFGVVAWQRRAHPVSATFGWIAVAGATAALMIGTMTRNREYRSPLTLAETSVVRWPSSVGEHILGAEWLAAGNKEEALSRFRRAVPGAPRAYYSLALTEFGEGQWDAAIRDFRAFLQAQPLLREAVPARLYLAQALGHESQWAEAIEQGRLMLTMHPSSDEASDATLLIADCLRGQQKYEAAAAQYQAYVDMRPNDARGATGLAMSLVGLNQTADAARWFTRAADLTPGDSAAQRNAAMALLETRRVNAAAEYAERAARLRPNDAVAHDMFGLVLLNQRKVPAAVEQFQAALRLDPAAPDVRAHLDEALRSSRLTP